MLRAMLYRRPTEPQAIELPFDGEIFLVRLRRHRQARRYTLRIQAATREVILTLPPRGTVKEAKAFAEKHGGWIAARIGRLPEITPFRNGLIIPLRGVPHRIVHRKGERGTVWTEEDNNGKPIICVAGDAEYLQRRVTDYLKREARRDLEVASRAYAEKLGVFIKRLTIRDQASRWGSCSTTGALSYSWRLIMAPPHVLDYLAAHEVAHMVEMNHSNRFWRLVRKIHPGYEKAKVWLDVRGTELHRYGAVGRIPLDVD
nr:SprT family zinc-dependent metalloprotease [Variibacter gotjawalensis]